jgi:hypothetical protein
MVKEGGHLVCHRHGYSRHGLARRALLRVDWFSRGRRWQLGQSGVLHSRVDCDGWERGQEMIGCRRLHSTYPGIMRPVSHEMESSRTRSVQAWTEAALQHQVVHKQFTVGINTYGIHYWSGSSLASENHVSAAEPSAVATAYFWLSTVHLTLDNTSCTLRPARATRQH